jgi:hypothetical protein
LRGHDGGLSRKDKGHGFGGKCRRNIEFKSEHQEVPNKEVAVEAIGALEDRYGDQRLAVRCHGQLKKRTQGNGGSQQKLAAPEDG